jgi:hypothetical protein
VKREISLAPEFPSLFFTLHSSGNPFIVDPPFTKPLLGPHFATSAWRWLRGLLKRSKDAQYGCQASTIAQ